MIRAASELFLCAALTSGVLAGCAAEPPATLPTPGAPPASGPASVDADAPVWRAIGALFNQEGAVNGNVCTITVPRADLIVNIEGMEVPTAAGIASQFHFYRCSCGKMSVVGEFIVTDYEANDVIDTLRAGHMVVAALAPLFLYDHPKLMLVRFQGEGHADELARTVRDAIKWTGKERMAPDAPVNEHQ